MKLPDYPIADEELRVSWGRQIVDFLRSITPQPGADIVITTTPNGTTFSLRDNSKRVTQQTISLYKKPFDLDEIGDDSLSIMDNKATAGGVWVDSAKQATFEVDGVTQETDHWTLTGLTGAKYIYLKRDHAAETTTIIAADDLPDGAISDEEQTEIIPLWYIAWEDTTGEDEEPSGRIDVAETIDLRDAYRLLTMRKFAVCADDGTSEHAIFVAGEPYTDEE